MAGATIVFCDIVGFSERNDKDQRKLINDLSAEVTHELYHYLINIQPTPDIISLPTGDGMALAFIDNNTFSWGEPLFSLLNRLMHWAVKKSPLRIGVHRGSVSIITDINRHHNVCGTTINVCQRIMDAAHPKQVLFSQDAFMHYVGHGARNYDGPPFSARFEGPIDITFKHGLSEKVYIMLRDNEPGWTRTEPFPSGVIIGKEERTAFIVERLKALCSDNQRPLTIYEQSGFSTFGIPDSRIRQRDSAFSAEYLNLLKQQRSLLNQIAQQDRTRLFLIVYPTHTQDALHRLEVLLEWMNSTRINADFVKSNYEGPNRLIVANEFSIEGYKLHRTAGYEMSIVHYNQYPIGEAIKTFMRVFNQAQNEGQTTSSVKEDIQNLKNQWSTQPCIHAE